jgi:tetrahydromethanopterin S-methyltransferase subunit F
LALLGRQGKMKGGIAAEAAGCQGLRFGAHFQIVLIR